MRPNNTAAAIFLICSLICLLSACQSHPARIDHLQHEPRIDGVLDESLRQLPIRNFARFNALDNPVDKRVDVTYRLAHSDTHLYIYIETTSDAVSYHRRGYLYGDGFKVVVGMPGKQGSTDEYFEIVYSPTTEEDYQWDRQRITAYNHDDPFTKLSQSSRSQEHTQSGKSGFEALISWQDIYPYHPLNQPEIGLNLYFAKGFDSEEHGYYTHGYSIVEDEAIWDEELSRRNVASFAFEPANQSTLNVVHVTPAQNHTLEGEDFNLTIVTGNHEGGNIPIMLELFDSTEQRVLDASKTLKATDQLETLNLPVAMDQITPGAYVLKATYRDSVSEHHIGVIPKIDFTDIRSQLSQTHAAIPTGSIETLLFNLDEVEQSLMALKPYEAGHRLLANWSEFQSYYQKFLQGDDPYLGQLGPYRRGFKSQQDGTYQPYSVRLPEDYDAAKSYPLLVFLHGSGQDEQTLLNRPRSNGEFIELAPFGRDKFRAYASNTSQVDIVEAIEAVKASYSVDENTIVVGGFSMGGYGALRAFYENPEIYAGVAVFAGHPNLASEWLDEDHPNFLETEYVAAFDGTPVFIYHGRRDVALDVDLMIQTATKLEEAGANVVLSIAEENGHEYQDDRTNRRYHEWLTQFTSD